MNFCRLIRLIALFLLAQPAAFPLFAVEKPGHATLETIDKRKAMLKPERAAGVERLKKSIPNARVSLDDITAAPKSIVAPGGALKQSKRRGPWKAGLVPDKGREVIIEFVAEHPALFGHDAGALDRARVVRTDTDQRAGYHSTVWRQQLDDVSVYEAVFVAHVSAEGELVSLGSQFVASPEDVRGGDASEDE